MFGPFFLIEATFNMSVFFPLLVAHFRRSFLYEADALISFRVCEGSSRSYVTHKCITQMAYYSNLRVQRDNYRHESHIQMTFRWWADDGPFIVTFGSSIPS